MNILTTTALIKTALGEKTPELVLKNCRVADLFTGKFRECDVAICGGRIAGLGSYDSDNVIDCGGRIAAPGYIEGHCHIESSMLTPAQYAAVVAPQGVTTLVADPHEIANVCGEKGLDFMLRSAADVPIDIEFVLPSCVPATPFERSGATLDAVRVKKLMKSGRFLGLGEMMNMPGVLACDGEVLGKLSCTDMLDGHAPGLSGKRLMAYAAAGIRTDHECDEVQAMLERLAAGMYVEIREGTQSKCLAALSAGINPRTLRRLLFCVDDRNLGDMLREGTIHNCVRRAVRELGVDPIDALTIASLNAAECYRMNDKGAIAPGRRADILLCDEVGGEISMVIKDGRLIAREGEALFTARRRSARGVRGTVRVKRVKAESFRLPFDPERPVIGVQPDSLVTTKERRESADGLTLCAVVERHSASGRIGLAYAAGLGIKGGAIAQTIAHDSHNITAAGDSAEDIAAAVNALGKNGGIAVVRGGKVTCFFELPIAGLMTDLPADEALKKHAELERAIAELGAPQGIEPSMLLSFLALPVIPQLKLTCDGLFDVDSFEFV